MRESYSWTDETPLSGNNFYRIRSLTGTVQKSIALIVKVTTVKPRTGSITIYPNPIKGNMVNLRFTDQPTGIYQVRMINNTGQLVYYRQVVCK